MAGSNYISGLNSLAVSNINNAKIQKLGTNMSAISQYKQGDKPADIATAYKKFEGMFIGQMMNTMFNTVPVSEGFGGGSAEETFRTMLVDEYSAKIAESGGMGIATKLIDQYNMVHGLDKNNKEAITDTNKAISSYNKANKL